MHTRPQRWIWTLALALWASPTLASAQAALVSGLGGTADFGTNVLGANDDGSSASIDITPVFPGGIHFFGTTHTTMYVNNNGNVTFGAPTGSFTPTPFPVSSNPMLAVWWSDVDTRGSVGSPAGANLVYWSLSGGRIVVTWYLVGFFSRQTSGLNSFQLVLTPSGTGGDFDVEYRYNRCDWVYGGSVQAGFDGGDFTNYRTLPNSRTTAIHQLCTDTNAGSPGVFQFSVRDGQIVPCGNGSLQTDEACDDGNGDTGDGCNATCHIETGFTCSGTQSVCTSVCGDGLVLGAEALRRRRLHQR